MKGHMEKDGFHPHTQYKGVRKSRDQNAKHEGVKIRKQRENSSKSLEKMFDLERKPVSKETDDFETKQYASIMLNDVTNWGFGDTGEAIDKALSVGLGSRELTEILEQFHEDTETPYDDMDVVAVLYDHILQNARSKIDEVIKYDFLNDFSGDGTEFYVAGNFMATTYDYSQSAVDELREKLMKANKNQLKELSDDIFVKSFLTDVDVFRN